jgi:hypothetical protein
MSRKFVIRSLIALNAVVATAAAVLVTVSVGPSPSNAAPSVAEVPYRMDASNQAGWWKPLDEWNGRVYLAFNAWGGPGPTNGGATDTHTVYIGERRADGTWNRGCLKNASGQCAVWRDDIGHNQPTIAVDGDGYIHAFVSMHNNDWRYYRSDAPGDVGSMVNRSSQMPDQGGKYTYPAATRSANGDVYLAVRWYPSPDAEARLYRWNNTANTWSRVAAFAAQAGYVPYIDDVVGSSNGDVGIAWEWAYGGAGGLRHRASYLRYSPATNRFYNAAGTAVTTPATGSSAVVYQPLEGEEQASDRDTDRDPGVQSAKVAFDPATGHPAIAYRYRSSAGGPFRVRLAEWTGSAWRRQTVYAGSYDTFAAVDVSLYGSGIRVYYAKQNPSGEDQAFAASRGTDGGWTETRLAAGVPVERLSVIRRGAVDHLYLAAPTPRQLHYGTSRW